MKLPSIVSVGGGCIRVMKLLVGWEAYFEEEIFSCCIDFNNDNDERGERVGCER